MSAIIHKTEEFIRSYYDEHFDPDYSFHSIKHTIRTVEGIRQLAKKEGLNQVQLEILTLAAWFHDVSVWEGYNNHEQRSALLAAVFLKENSYDQESIEAVKACILATSLSKEPSNLMEKVIKDADILHLGKNNFFKRNKELRHEWEKKKAVKADDEQWLKDDISFFDTHPFYTDFARKKYGEQRAMNRAIIADTLNRIRSDNNPEQDDSEKTRDLPEKITKKIGKIKRPDRGVETMFRVTSRNHFTLSSIADSKAGTLISVSALIISLILSLLVSRLDERPFLIIPTVMLLLTLLVTIIFAVLSTRPKVTSLNLKREDIRQKKGNLLFFGNFINMPLEDYEWGMTEIMNDRDYLYKNLIRDIYYLGIVLGKKYRFLRYAYDSFMYGLIVSLLTYILAFAI